MAQGRADLRRILEVGAAGQEVDIVADRGFWCRIGLHHFVDFPDPNPETRGLEQQGYRACTRCSATKDVNVYLSRSGRWRLPTAAAPRQAEGQPLHPNRNSRG